MCYNRYSTTASDFFEPVNTHTDKKKCLQWQEVISGYQKPASWKYTPLDLPDASLTEAQNYCRVLGAFPFYPVCFGKDPQKIDRNEHYMSSTAPAAFLSKCDVELCPMHGQY